jgi:hypothetical protein
MHIVWEREKRVARTSHPIQLVQPFFFLPLSQWRNLRIEQTFPVNFFAAFQNFARDIEVDGIRLFGAFNTFLEGKREDTRVMA